MNPFHEHRRQMRVLPISRRQKKEIPDDVFETCPQCHRSLLRTALYRRQSVCPHCGHHFSISARERIRQIADPGTFREIDARLSTRNIYGFEGYDQKLEKARQATDMKEAVLCGFCRIDGSPAAIGVMDARFMMASMGMVVGEKICRLIRQADHRKLPLILFCASGGARMQEGILSLVQMARTTALLEEFSEHGGLYISVLTHPTTGGVSASFASRGDLQLAEPDALIGFAGRRVIEKTIQEELPPDFQRAESLLSCGFLDAVVERTQMKSTLSYLLRIHQGGTA